MRTREGQTTPQPSASAAAMWAVAAPGAPVSGELLLELWAEPCGDARLCGAGWKVDWCCTKPSAPRVGPRPTAPFHSSRTLGPQSLARSDPTWALWKACPTHPGVKTKGHVPSSRGPHWLAQGRRAENMLVAMGSTDQD